MRVNQEEMDKNHDKIVSSAAELIRERGTDSASVQHVMQAAGLTHGGFYRHFKDKDSMLIEALEFAFNTQIDFIKGLSESEDQKSTQQRFDDMYLSKQHADNPRLGCPVVALADDVARGTPALKESFTEGVRRMLDEISTHASKDVDSPQQYAILKFTQMVGAVLIARACDDEMAALILETVKNNQ
jgi:TetR/AcrR family transcriptional regulator, transcriptional repressor for nem operon